MGRTVYAVTSSNPHLRAYVHNSKEDKTSSAALLINIHRKESCAVDFRGDIRELYLATAQDLFGKEVLLNGKALQFGEQSRNTFDPIVPGSSLVTLPPCSYAFVISQGTIAVAANRAQSCPLTTGRVL